MIDRLSLGRASLLDELAAQYRQALEVAESQLHRLILERAIRQLCHEYVERHGGAFELGHLHLEIHKLDHRIRSKEHTIERMREHLGECHEQLRAVGPSRRVASAA